jgi:uncharacterized protein (DUF736 family)
MDQENTGLGEMPVEQTPEVEIEEAVPASKQPEFRVVQPEYDPRDGKTHFRDVGALWKNISQKTGREFYTLKIGKLRLLVFPNQKISQQQE